MATAPVFQEVVDEHPGEFMVVDLCSCGFMDSSGVAVVIRRHRLDPERLHVACVPKGATARIFEIAVQKTIPIHASVEDAVAALQHLT
ncbi:MAG: hypothetical protein JWM31_45 [Solirubrobacterales bacterium]|nr:hypothetical protein [Solirubrobacterales bacterium]